MGDGDVEQLLAIEPFASMDEEAFPKQLPLRGILRNDMRIIRYQTGDLIVREGDYGSSAFLILDGRVRVALRSFSPEMLGRKQASGARWWRVVASLWPRRAVPEARHEFGKSPKGTGSRDVNHGVGIFLQDIPRVLEQTGTVQLGPGEIFGELAALARTPRSATVFAEGEATLVEIRWQGLRDLMRRTPALRHYVEQLYRENSLRVHLRETPLLRTLPAAALEHVAQHTIFQSYGNFDWHTDFGTYHRRDPLEQIAREPLMAEEGQNPGALLLIRGGFARQSRRHGNGHRTLAYLGKGEVFGLPELAGAFRSGRDVPLVSSLRAVGYVDVLLIPRETVFQHVFPNVESSQLPHAVGPAESTLAIDTGLVDFLVDHRFVNGTQTMLINLDRCTRCDDCVRACAATHDGNPRFIRHGPKHDHLMIATACMHCVDPVCMIGCPTGAIGRDATSGIVAINDRTCIGCAACANSCPYEAIRLVEIRDGRGAFLIDEASQLPIVKATKCDLCSDWPGGPACQRACPHDALVRMDMADEPALAAWLGRQNAVRGVRNAAA
jgi:Fe-S-cluster-containing dehydrogenase component/CRP-like cAMP-binding protein